MEERGIVAERKSDYSRTKADCVQAERKEGLDDVSRGASEEDNSPTTTSSTKRLLGG